MSEEERRCLNCECAEEFEEKEIRHTNALYMILFLLLPVVGIIFYFLRKK